MGWIHMETEHEMPRKKEAAIPLKNSTHTLWANATARGCATAEDEPIICEICKKGHVTKRTEQLPFRQWSDKGYIHCRVTILVGSCDNCRVKSLDPGSEKILDEAFKREYEKLTTDIQLSLAQELVRSVQ
jgi:hypothetical protein